MTAAPASRRPAAAIVRHAWAWWLGELRALLPPAWRGERRIRVDADIRLAPERWVLRDRTGAVVDLDPHDAPALAAALAALKGRRRQVRVGVSVPLSRCFVRRTEVLRAMLGHARAILSSELDVATPFHAGNVRWDWFVHGPGAAPGTLGLTQVVAKRRDTAVALDRLAAAGALVVRLGVEDDSAKPLPVNLLRHEDEPGREPETLRVSRRVLVGAAVVASLAVGPVAITQQSATRERLDTELAEAQDALVHRPGLARAPLEALGRALALKRTMPPTHQILDRLAAALPPDSVLDHLFLDGDVLTIQGQSGSVKTLERALGASPLFAAGHNTATGREDGRAFTIRLKVRPMPPEA